MSRHHAVQPLDALRALEFIIGWGGGHLPTYRRGDDTRDRIAWHQTAVPGSGRRLAELVRVWDERHSHEVLIGLPQARRWNGGVGAATVLWCRIEGGEQERRARALRPLPSMVLQEGGSTRRWLIWALRERVPYSWLQDANRKLAYAIGATQRHGDPDAFLVPAPGTCLRVGRARPVPVVCSRLTMADYTADQVVGRLKEPPELKPWWERAAQ